MKWWHIGLLLALATALLSPLASTFPDGLEWVAEEKGFNDDALEPAFKVIPDYLFPGLENEASATILGGLVGTLILFGLTYGLGALLRRGKTNGA